MLLGAYQVPLIFVQLLLFAAAEEAVQRQVAELLLERVVVTEGLGEMEFVAMQQGVEAALEVTVEMAVLEQMALIIKQEAPGLAVAAVAVEP